jgi:hypothetical protein
MGNMVAFISPDTSAKKDIAVSAAAQGHVSNRFAEPLMAEFSASWAGAENPAWPDMARQPEPPPDQTAHL